MKCERCQAWFPKREKTCPKCGRRRPKKTEEVETNSSDPALVIEDHFYDPAARPGKHAIEEKYPALKVVALILKILAALMIIGDVVVVSFFARGIVREITPWAVALLITSVFFSVVIVVFVYAVGEGIQLLIDIEKNTRVT